MGWFPVLTPRTRQIIYIVTALGTPLVAWANARGWIDELEVSLWSAEVAVVGGLAAMKTGTPAPPVAAENITAGEQIEAIPADQATSDTKVDAAGYDPRHAETIP